VTDGPNHHQRIMIRQSSGGFSKDLRRSAMGSAGLWACARTGELKLAAATMQKRNRHLGSPRNMRTFWLSALWKSLEPLRNCCRRSEVPTGQAPAQRV